MEGRQEIFEYTYSAKQQEEIQNIRKKYLPKEEDKMEQLRRLDQSATKKGTIVSIIVGIAGCLIMGTGMCCSMALRLVAHRGVVRYEFEVHVAKVMIK